LSEPASPPLSPSQLAGLAEIGEERSANVGELLYEVGDLTYPFVAILEREVAIIDAAGNELIRHGPAGFLGELNLLAGQTVFVTDWLDDTVARDRDGFVLTGAAANADGLLETDIPGVFAAGDVRSGSTKRCATAVGEGAMAVQLVHAHLSQTPAAERAT